MSTPRAERTSILQLSNQHELPQNKDAGPLKNEDVLNNMLRVAGVTEELMASIALQAVEKLPQLMNAKKKTYWAPTGIPEHYEEDDDNPTQLKATELALKFTQAFKAVPVTKHIASPVVGGSLSITLPDFYTNPDNKEVPNDNTTIDVIGTSGSASVSGGGGGDTPPRD